MLNINVPITQLNNQLIAIIVSSVSPSFQIILKHSRYHIISAVNISTCIFKR